MGCQIRLKVVTFSWKLNKVISCEYIITCFNCKSWMRDIRESYVLNVVNVCFEFEDKQISKRDFWEKYFLALISTMYRTNLLGRDPNDKCWVHDLFRWVHARKTQLHYKRTRVTSFLHLPIDFLSMAEKSLSHGEKTWKRISPVTPHVFVLIRAPLWYNMIRSCYDTALYNILYIANHDECWTSFWHWNHQLFGRTMGYGLCVHVFGVWPCYCGDRLHFSIFLFLGCRRCLFGYWCMIMYLLGPLAIK